MTDIFDVLDDVRLRPGMFLGRDPAHWLDRLESFVLGYGAATRVRGHRGDPGLNLSRELGTYLRARFGWSMWAGPFDAIRASVDHDEVLAWERFWILLADYRETVRPARPRHEQHPR